MCPEVNSVPRVSSERSAGVAVLHRARLLLVLF